MSVEKTLRTRHDRYGRYADLAPISQNLQVIMAGSRNWQFLTSVQREALQMIASKIARILNGDPNHVDSWHDIGGYAKLVEDNLGETPCPVDTTPSTSSNTRKPRSKSRSEKPETRPATISSEPEKFIRGTASTSTIDDLLRRVEATNQAIGGSDPATPTAPKGT